MAVTPYMNLSLPTVSVTTGPGWASQINAALTALDAHTHAPGSGVAISAAALSIDGDVSWAGHNLTTLRTARFQNLGAPPALGTDIACLAVAGGNLYYINASGQAVQVTAGAALNAASIGAIGGDYSTSGASETYTSASKTFTFLQAASTWANIDVGNVVIRQPGVTSPHGITLQSPASLAADYALTLPASLPASTKILAVSNTGIVSAVYDVDGVTLQVSANALGVKPGGLTTSHLSASAGILGSQLSASAGITAAQTTAVSAATAGALVVRDGSGRAQFASPSVGSDAANMSFVVSYAPTAVFYVTGAGAATLKTGNGAGISISRSGAGTYLVNMTTYAATTMMLATAQEGAGVTVGVTQNGGGSWSITMSDAADHPFGVAVFF